LNFYNEISTFQPPRALVEPLSRRVTPEQLLFPEPRVRDQRAGDGGFEVQLEGELASGDDLWAEFAEAANWVLEIRARRASIDYAIAPTIKTRAELPRAQSFTASIDHPDPTNGPYFDARIFIREGSTPRAMQAKFRRAGASGVRIYL